MKIFDVEQGSIDWLRLRAGVPTASDFHRIITPGGKASAQAEDYMCRLLAERILGEPILSDKTEWMERGNELEPDAVALYEMHHDVDVLAVGFVTTDDGRVGCSPDRLIGDDGLLEIKCPAPQTHIAYLLEKDIGARYRCQVQGQLWVTGRSWLDIISYHPKMPPAISRIERDSVFISALAREIYRFLDELDERTERLKIRFEELRLDDVEKG